MLVVAPAGFGKTALVAELLRELPARTARAWVRCDPEDDLGSFTSSLAAALEPYDLPWQVDPNSLAALAEQQHGLQRVARELCSVLAASEVERGVIALDDLQGVADPRVVEVLDAMLQHLPAAWTVIICSRSDPTLSLSRLWVQGLVAEFRQSDLRFSIDEVRGLIQAWDIAPAGAD